MINIIHNEINEHLDVVRNSITLGSEIEKAAKKCINALKNNGKILIFGNGGSSADAQHIAAELVSRYKTEREGLAAIALTTDTSILTAVGNDYGFDKIFSRQVEALANKGDVVIGISTGGTSVNVLNGFEQASKKKCDIIGFSGKGGGRFNEICNINLIVPSNDTPRIQEMHILIGHIICDLIEQSFTAN